MSQYRSADHALMHEMNIALILECLRQESPLSRARLAQLTGLTKATVSSLVQELLDARFLKENHSLIGEKGRPSIPLMFNPDAGALIGAEIGVDFFSVILTNFAAEILWRYRENISPDHTPQPTLNQVIPVMRTACCKAQEAGYPILGAGLGIPGQVDVSSGTLLEAVNLRWVDVPIKTILQEQFKFPVHIDNDTKMAALGESFFGAARGCDYVLYISASYGVGAGLVIKQQIFSGFTGQAGEVGHMTLNPDGPLCNCGNRGCWEMYVSQKAIYGRVQTIIGSGRLSSLSSVIKNGEQISFPLILEAARNGDAVSLEVLREAGRYLGLGIANLINAFNPELVVLGGMLSQAHEFMLPEIESVVRERALRLSRQAPKVVIASQGSDSCVMGGIATVYHRVLSQPFVVSRTVTQPDPCR